MTYYVLDTGDNKIESMSKEQILAAITQAISTGQIQNVDTGFVSTIKEINHQQGLKFWYGTMAEFNAIGTKEPNTFYIFSDDTTLQDIENKFNAQQEFNKYCYDKFDNLDLVYNTLGFDGYGIQANKVFLSDGQEVEESIQFINNRLKALGFKEGSATTSLAMSISNNQLKKQGKYVLFNFEASIGSFLGNLNIIIPSEFRPKVDTEIMVKINAKISPGLPSQEQCLITTVKTDGTILIGSMLDTLEAKIINAGWEIN